MRPRMADRRLSLLLLMLSLLWQSLLVQTHVHRDAFDAAPSLQAGAASPAAAVRAHDPAKPADTCLLCREQGLNGSYIPPTPPQLLGEQPRHVAWTAPSASASSDEQRSHSWRSRAPPTL